MKKLVYGVGVNSKGKYPAHIGRRPLPCYDAWKHMLGRCYDPAYRLRNPTYEGCTVEDVWLDFQVFAEWYHQNYPKDGLKYHLDKDLKIIGNKIYGPDTCLFVTHAVNCFTTNRGNDRGSHMIGVSFYPSNGKYCAHCGDPVKGVRKFLGYYENELEAHMAWRNYKSSACLALAEQQKDQRVKDALIRWKAALDSNEIHPILE